MDIPKHWQEARDVRATFIALVLDEGTPLVIYKCWLDGKWRHKVKTEEQLLEWLESSPQQDERGVS